MAGDDVDELMRAVDLMRALMLDELVANSRKGDRPGWMAAAPMALVLEVFHHAAKLHHAVNETDRLKKQGASESLINSGLAFIREYAADTANMAMMVADRCGVLGLPKAEPGPKGNNTAWVDEAVTRMGGL